MTMRRYCLDEQDLERAEASLLLAQKLGLIEKAGLDEMEKRRREKNGEIERKLQQGELVYGLRCYSPAAYLQYELTRFRLDFTEQLPVIREHYVYAGIDEEQKHAFYEQNQDLFTRYWGDLMTYEEVTQIIEKRIREAEYDALVEDLLCQLREGK